MQLQPQASFTVVRQIENHLDTDTNYVQAVIRNAYTDAVIDTLQLTNKGSQRFSKNWQVPADPSGQGFYISIVTSVYTDSGYTTKNANYGDQESTYLVQERVLLGGGGGGVDGYTVRRIVAEELDKRPVSLEPVTGAIGALQREINRLPKEGQFDGLVGALQAVMGAIKRIPTEPDYAPVQKELKALRAAIKDKEVTPATDLTPLQEEITGRLTELFEVLDGAEKQIDTTVKKSMRATNEELLKRVKETLDETTFNMAPITMQKQQPQPKEEKAPVPFDLRQLAE